MMKYNLIKFGIFLSVLAILTLLSAYTTHKKVYKLMPTIDPVNANDLQAISQKRIVFGHQSVGVNILSGLQYLAGQVGINLKIIDCRSTSLETGITHFKIGINEDPESKINDFAETLRSGVVQEADIAIIKLCYVDIKRNTDVRKLADTYISSLTSLSKEFPHTFFIAVTVPITTVQRGPKAWLKGLSERDPDGYADNFRRQEFNNILRNSYVQQGRLFDLAKYEAEGTDRHQFQGLPFETMNPAMTNDGGHLNEFGSRFVAAKLIKFISSNI